MALREFGSVLFMTGNQLTPSQLIESPSEHAVALYDDNMRKRLVNTLGSEASESYLGDYHAHPVGQAWLSQFPSPEDVVTVSVLADLWPNDLGVPIRLAPTFQIVQSLLFGDLFVMESTPTRKLFSSLRQQTDALESVRAVYASAHSLANDRHGPVPLRVTHQGFRDVVDDVVLRLNGALGERGIIRYVPNPEANEEWTRISTVEAAQRRVRNQKKRERKQHR